MADKALLRVYLNQNKARRKEIDGILQQDLGSNIRTLGRLRAEELWRAKHNASVLRDEIERLLEEKRKQDSGVIAYDLLFTPRYKVQDRTVAMSLDRKAALRRMERGNRTSALMSRMNELKTKLQGLDELIQWDSGGHLPELHSDLLRNAMVDLDDVEKVRRIVRQKGEATRESLCGWTALHIAVQQGQMPVVQVLLTAPGLDINQQDDAGYTALHYACMMGNLEMAKCLLKAGADPTVRNREDHTPAGVAEAMGLGGNGKMMMEVISLREEGRFITARFYYQLFAGDPLFWHYKTPDYQVVRLVAYTFLFHNSMFADGTRIVKRRGGALHREALYDFNGLVKIVFGKEPEKRWKAKLEGWRELDPGLFNYLEEVVFKGNLTAVEIEKRVSDGRMYFEKWKLENADELIAEQKRAAEAATDALRLKRIREIREQKQMEEQEAKEKKEREEARKQPLNPEAAVIIDSDEPGSLRFVASEAEPATYFVSLATEPLGTVLIRIVVKPDVSGDKSQLKVTPKLITFVEENWMDPVEVTVDLIDDDSLVRLKRDLAAGKGQHHVEHSIQHSTDRSYKQAELVWDPTRLLPIWVSE